MLLDQWSLLEPTPGGAVPRRPAYGEVPYDMVSRGHAAVLLRVAPSARPVATQGAATAALALTATATAHTRSHAAVTLQRHLAATPDTTTAIAAFDGERAVRAVLAAEDDTVLALLLSTEARWTPPPSPTPT